MVRNRTQALLALENGGKAPSVCSSAG